MNTKMLNSSKMMNTARQLKTMRPYVTISQIKRDNEASKSTNDGFIETMYRNGGEFKFDLTHTQGSYKDKLQILEEISKGIISDMNSHKNELQSLKVQSDNMNRELKQDYEKIKREITDNTTELELKLKLELNKQKTKNLQLNQEMSQLKKDTLDVRNLLLELKRRTSDLQIRVGHK